MFAGMLRYCGDAGEAVPAIQRLEIAQRLLHQARGGTPCAPRLLSIVRALLLPAPASSLLLATP